MKIDEVLKENISNVGVINEFTLNVSGYNYLKEYLIHNGMGDCVRKNYIKYLGMKINKI